MTTLRLYNTLTKTKEDFVPLDANNVRMYVCGPTVYDYAHIGNARPVIVFDVLFRLLRHVYGADHVTYVRNITDIDDKINARAASKGVAIREITEKTARQYNEDVAALGCLPPTIAPRATDNVDEMIAMIAQLIDAGHAYPAEGHVLFDVSSKPDYGKLARRSLDEMIAGARVDIAPYKKSPMDFVLWKPSDEATPGWESPWGRGRPGWHIECSAMIEATFKFEEGGETIDIHGGGIDLVFPHHENEIAQSEGAHRDHPLAKVWMHNGFLQVEGEKMSKSLGNFTTIRQLLDQHTGDTLRFHMLETHYRQPIDWTAKGISRARAELRRWSEFVVQTYPNLIDVDLGHVLPDPQFFAALSDDLNTPQAFSRLREMFSHARDDRGKSDAFIWHAVFLGFSNLDRPGYFQNGFSLNLADSKKKLSDEEFFTINAFRAATANSDFERARVYERRSLELGYTLSLSDNGSLLATSKELDETPENFIEAIEEKIEARIAARKAKDFKQSDRIRDELLAQGIVLKDNADGTTSWDVKR